MIKSFNALLLIVLAIPAMARQTATLSPEMTSMLVAQYSHTVFRIKKRIPVVLVVRGERARIGDQYFYLGNNIRQRSYDLLHTRFGLSASNVELMLWMRNITDKTYIAYAYDFGAVHHGNPRTFGFTLFFKR